VPGAGVRWHARHEQDEWCLAGFAVRVKAWIITTVFFWVGDFFSTRKFWVQHCPHTIWIAVIYIYSYMNELKWVKLFWVHVIFSTCSFMNWSGLKYFEYTWYFQDYTRNQKVVTWFLLRRFPKSLRVNATLLGNPLREPTLFAWINPRPSSVDWSLVILIPQNGWSTKTICEQGSWDLILQKQTSWIW